MSLTDVQVFSTGGRALHTAGAGSSLGCVDCKLLRSTGTQALGELSASLNLQGVHIAEGTGDGVVVTGHDTAGVITTCTVEKQQGAGVRVQSGGVTFSGSSVSTCGSAVVVEQAGSVDLTDAWISDCHAGVTGSDEAKIRARSSSFVNVGGTAALSMRSEGTRGDMQGCCVRSCTHGCVLAEAGARCEMAECKLEHNGAPCVHSLGSKSAVVVHQCTFEGNAGPCIRVACGASAAATDCGIRESEGSAVCIDGRESTGKLERCALKDTGNHVVIAQAGGSCQLGSCTIERSRAGAGLVALGEGSQIKCTGGSVAGMQQAACVAKDAAAVQCDSVKLQQTVCGSGCIATAGGFFTARSCTLQDNSDHGILAAEGGCAQLQACKCDSPCKFNSTPHAPSDREIAWHLIGSAFVSIHNSAPSSSVMRQGARCCECSQSLQEMPARIAFVTSCATVHNGDLIQYRTCRVVRNRIGCGIFVADSKSQVNAGECKLEENGNCGVLVTGGGSLALHLCEVIEHMRGAGAVVHGKGSLVDLQESTIVGCGAAGLMAFDGARAECKRVRISFASTHGVEVCSDTYWCSVSPFHMGLLF